MTANMMVRHLNNVYRNRNLPLTDEAASFLRWYDKVCWGDPIGGSSRDAYFLMSWIIDIHKTAPETIEEFMLRWQIEKED